jgi:nitrate reductase molybdenum cofactor assembly chaperone NarJ/NarW
MNKTLKALSVLLGYPDVELKAAVPEIRAALHADGALSAGDLRALAPLLAQLASDNLYDLQERYSGLFDTSGALSLHVFEHVHGESRERGQALVDLAQRYEEHGLLLQGSELPDYLPLLLEFVSCLPPQEARDWLQQPAHVFAAIGERLDQRSSPYAGVFTALLALARTAPDADALEAVRQRLAAQEARSLDETWREEPVSFAAAPAPQATTGIVQRLRAAVGR